MTEEQARDDESWREWTLADYRKTTEESERRSEERRRMRELQDHLLSLAERHGLADTMRLCSNPSVTITIGDLRRYIYPSFEGEIREAIAELERWDRS